MIEAGSRMNIAAVLALQSIPFAALVLLTTSVNRDLFTVLYAAALGLTLSLIAVMDGIALYPVPFGAAHDVHR